MDIIRVIMCEGAYHGLYRLENRSGQYYWCYISISNSIYRETYQQLNIEKDRESSAIHKHKGYFGNFILFKEQDLLEV